MVGNIKKVIKFALDQSALSAASRPAVDIWPLACHEYNGLIIVGEL